MAIPQSLEALTPWLEDAWLERYLNRETTPEETAWFEAYMLEHPHVADALETDAAITAALSQQSPQGIELRVEVRRESGVTELPRRKWSRPAWFGVAAAAVLTVALSSTLVWHKDDRLAAVQASRALFDPSRSAEAVAFNVLDDRGSAWTMLEIHTASKAAEHEVRIGGQTLGRFRSDEEGVLEVLLNAPVGDLQAQDINVVRITDLQSEPVMVSSKVNLDAGGQEVQQRVCRLSRELRSTTDPLRFVTVGGRLADYIDILHVRDDNAPDNPCISDRQGWTADEYIFICRDDSSKDLSLFAHIKSNTAVDFICNEGRPVTLTAQDGQYSSAYWDDFTRGFRYYVMLEWNPDKCATAGCEPYFIESFDLDSLAVAACFNHQPAMELPSEMACAELPASKQTDDGNGEKPPRP